MNTGPRVPRCLILLACYNGAQYIREQVQSIFSQQDVAVEILVGDDASSDTTVEIIQGIATAGALRILRSKTGSGSAAQNFARLFREADASAFDFVALSDQDDIWLPNKLRRATDALVSSGSAGYSCSVIARWPDGRQSLLHQSPHLRAADYLFEGAGQGCSFVVTRALFEHVQAAFRQRADLTSRLIYHDWAIYALARSRGMKWRFDAEPFVLYRQHGRNDTGARYSLTGITRRLQLFRDGRYAAQVAAVTALCLDSAPGSPLPRRWLELDSCSPQLARKLRKAAFCALHGRRKLMDRLATAMATLAGWL